MDKATKKVAELTAAVESNVPKVMYMEKGLLHLELNRLRSEVRVGKGGTMVRVCVCVCVCQIQALPVMRVVSSHPQALGYGSVRWLVAGLSIRGG